MDNTLEFAIKLSKKSGKLLLRHFHKLRHIKSKNSNPLDLITEADLLSEKLIFSQIKKKFPTHGIYGEESNSLSDSKESRCNYTWVVDPLDGTVNYAYGLDHWCVSIALLNNNKKPILSVIHLPLTNQTFYAQKGKGSFLNGVPIKVTNSLISSSIVSISISHQKKRADKAIKLIKELHSDVLRVRSVGSSSIEFAYTACGRFGGCVNFSSSDWDLLPGKLLVEQAGGIVLGTKGQKELSVETGFVAGSKSIVNSILGKSKKIK